MFFVFFLCFSSFLVVHILILCVFAFQAIAANKRLRDALDKHKVVQNERTGKLEKCDSAGIGNRVRVRKSIYIFLVKKKINLHFCIIFLRIDLNVTLLLSRI